MRPRGTQGSTVIELLIASVVMSMMATAFLAILLFTMKSNAKVSNMHDTMSAMRRIKEYLGADLRMGRSLGDCYGAYDPVNEIIQGSAQFPSTQDPIYGTNQTPPNGWPAAWPSPPYTLSNTCLIVQIPILDNHNDSGTTHHNDITKYGWPTVMTPSSPGLNPVPTSNQDNVETHVYMVVADPQNPGEYLLQVCTFPGYAVTGYVPAAHNIGPETVLTGITGPLDPNTGTPKVFQFLDKTNTTGATAGAPRDTITPSGAFVANYTGVVVNLQIREHQDTSLTRKDISLQPMAFKMEVFLRNNALATSTGQP